VDLGSTPRLLPNRPQRMVAPDAASCIRAEGYGIERRISLGSFRHGERRTPAPLAIT
jgi:hypothetical protein